jgi:hypothetical protein
MKSTADINRERNLKILEQRRTFKTYIQIKNNLYKPIIFSEKNL